MGENNNNATVYWLSNKWIGLLSDHFYFINSECNVTGCLSCALFYKRWFML